MRGRRAPGQRIRDGLGVGVEERRVEQQGDVRDLGFTVVQVEHHSLREIVRDGVGEGVGPRHVRQEPAAVGAIGGRQQVKGFWAIAHDLCTL